MSEVEFVEGLFIKAPHANAPDFVKAAVSIQPAKLLAWLQKHAQEEWVNVQVKESPSGKWYAAVDRWKPAAKDPKPKAPEPANARAPAQESAPFADDDIPF